MADDRVDEISHRVQTRACEADELTLPLAVEEISVSKRIVPTGRVVVSRVTRECEEVVHELLAREHVEVERIAVGKPIDTIPAVREDGDTIVIPIVEEVLTLERRLVLKEEVRIRKVREMGRYEERIMLRKQEAEVERLPVKNAIEVRDSTV